MTAFRDIQFGFASAEEEGARARSLIRDGFLDLQGVIREATAGSRYLFLGYKGSGKWAIGERLRLLAEDDSLLFVNTVFLSDFPYSTFSNIFPGDAEPESRYPAAWSWLLMLTLIKSLLRDNGATSSSALDLERLKRLLEKTGLLALDDIKSMVLVSSKKAFKLQIPKIMEGSVEFQYAELDLQFHQLVSLVRRVLCSFTSDSRHLLVVDGLDDILTARDVQYQSLAGLVLAASRLNVDMARSGTSAKVVLLCRTDLFEKLPGTNKNKIRQDSGWELDWYHDPRQPTKSMLYELANLRARLSSPAIDDFVKQFLPPSVERKSTARFLLDLTRHTPRDFLQLLNHLQRFAPKGRMNEAELLSGARDYSLNYFLPELKDELVGYVPKNATDDFFEVLGSLRKREFKYADLRAAASGGRLDGDLLKDSLRALFVCSGVGNVNHRPSGTVYYNFKYRNRNASLSLQEPLLLHMGTWKALNLI